MLYMRKTFSYEYPLEEAQVSLVGVPWDGTETGMPVRFGPLFIREAIRNVPGFDAVTGTNPFRSMRLADLGDVEIVPGDWKRTRAFIEDSVKHILEINHENVPVFLGGEHLITLPIVETFAEFHKGLTVVQLDAHRDLMPNWMGNRHSHITWARHAVSNSFISMVQLGARSWNKEEEPLIRKVSDSLEGIRGKVYLSIDLDVLDPSDAPEVGTPEPGGMSIEEVLRIVSKVSGMELVGMDIVECASQRVGTRTALLAARIFREMLIGIEAKEGGLDKPEGEVHEKG